MTQTLRLRAAVYTRFSRADGDSDSCETQAAMARKTLALMQDERRSLLARRQMRKRRQAEEDAST